MEVEDHDLLIELKKDIEYIKAKLRMLCEYDSHLEERVRAIEQKYAYIMGVACAIAFVVSLLVSWMGS
ncbi:hypothetical protein DRN72_04405 [Methanosarcinales archaeon]|nr:MAG: hypothetical protein DRN72_04405 [Methanosarcinales archaeon]